MGMNHEILKYPDDTAILVINEEDMERFAKILIREIAQIRQQNTRK